MENTTFNLAWVVVIVALIGGCTWVEHIRSNERITHERECYTHGGRMESDWAGVPRCKFEPRP